MSGAALDTSTKSASAPLPAGGAGGAAPPPRSLEERERAADGRDRAWALRDAAAVLLPESRVTGCGRRVIPGKAATVVMSDGRASFGNIMKCGSIWLCAVCQHKVARERASEVQRAVVAAQEMGLAVLFMTLTASHTRADRLEDLSTAQAKARRGFWSGRAAVKRAERFGIVGSISNLEVTWGEGTGWHPHSHVLIFADPERLEGISEELWSAWERAANNAGLDVARSGFDLRQVELGDEDSIQRAAHYVCKPGSSPRWGAGTELAMSGAKDADRGRWSPMELLAQWQSTLNGALAARFQEYATVFEGRRQLFWSRGLRALLGLLEEGSDEELANAEGAGEVVGVLADDEWAYVIGAGLGGWFLRIVEAEGTQGGFMVALGALRELMHESQRAERANLAMGWGHASA